MTPDSKRLIPSLIALLLFALLAIASVRIIQTQGQARLKFVRNPDSQTAVLAWNLNPDASELAKARGDHWFRAALPPQPRRALPWYREAIRLNPCESFHWADWGEVNASLGNHDQADRAFGIAESLDPNNHIVHQRLADYLLARGRIDDALPHHRRAIELNPPMARAIYPIYWGLGRDPVELAAQLLGDDAQLRRDYFRDGLAWMPPAQSASLWEGSRQAIPEAFDAPTHAAYFNHLIARRDYAAARALWDEILAVFYKVDDPGAADRLFWNGSFDFAASFEGGLEWRFEPRMPRGVTAVVASSRAVQFEKSLWIHFSALENTAFSHVSHRFFVEPGTRYRMTWNVYAFEVTTDGGPFPEVIVHGEKDTAFAGPAVTGTGDWKHQIEFAVPDGAQWATLRIRRNQIQKLHNQIKGDVWYDNFKLEPLTE